MKYEAVPAAVPRSAAVIPVRTFFKNTLNCIFLTALLFMVLVCNCATDDTSDMGEFSNPERVTITGHDGASDDAMEPFISRDGQYLFFNTNASVGNKDIYVASRVSDTAFTLVSPLGNVNSAEVDGVPTMDSSQNFYFISTVNYNGTTIFDTIYTGTFDSVNSRIDGITAVTGLADGVNYHVNFDVDISPDGKTMYYVDGVYNTSWVPVEANIAIAVDSGGGFAKDPQSDTIMANINTSSLEYAPCISSQGLELFFTRFDGTEFGIYRATRPDSGSAFGSPQKITAITGEVEGPALSPDGRSLYYHKKVDTRYVLYRVTR